MKRSILLLIFTVLTVFCSCTSKQEQSLGQGSDVEVSAMVEAPAFTKDVKFTPPTIKADEEISESDNSKNELINSKPTVNKSKIIKDGNISVQTNDINTSKKSIDALLNTLKAYYESEDLQNNDQTISYDLKVRVPSESFEKLITSIENGKDEIKSKSIQARDVTEEYMDIETRLTNKREYLLRYKVLLIKATTVKDILAIEENMRKLQEEIESKEGRLKYLNDQVSFSTLYINLYKTKEFIYKPEPQDKFLERVKKSVSNGWASVVNFVLWIITVWPYIILIWGAFFVFRRIVKKRKNSQS